VCRIPQATLEQVKKALRKCREEGSHVPNATIFDLVSLLDSEDNFSVPARLDAAGFSIMVEISLQSEYSRAAERGSFLLAVGVCRSL
jgi:hypothetical protein